jgi:hypothetical protein
MHFPRFWKKANDGQLIAWGWSDTSPDDAAANASSRAQRIREWLSKRDRKSRIDTTYGYPDRPMREEVLREFQDAQGQLAAVVSRNRAGCLVLNTANLMFVDIDIDEPRTKPDGLLSRLFGGKKAAAPGENPIERKIKTLAAGWLVAHPGWGWRIYRTRAGIRMIATHAPVQQGDPVVADAFSAFNADPLYRNLCERQQCFRARLTPKSWRCKIPNLRAYWPWESEKAEAKFRAWEQHYLNAAKDFATCRLIGQFGAQEIHPSLAELVAFHDKATRVDTDMPLA